MGAHPLFGPLSRRGLNPIKPVYDPDRPDGRLKLTASAFNQLGQYTSSPGRRVRATATQNSPFSSLSVAVTIASTHCAYPRRDGQAELAWVAGYVVR